MNDVFTVCFFGHRKIDNFKEIENKVFSLVCHLIKEHEYTFFLIGRDGDFDRIVSSSIKKAQKTLLEPNIYHTLVLPYCRAEYKNNEKSFENYYDAVEICETSVVCHPKAAIQIRNKNMVDRSDFCIFFVEHQYGGAWKTMKYALDRNKPLINLADIWPK